MQGIKALGFDNHRTLVLRTAGLLCPAAGLVRVASGILRTLSGGNAMTTAPLRRGGRPSREAAALLGERILDVATELFLAEGYGATSIEAVAQRVPGHREVLEELRRRRILIDGNPAKGEGVLLQIFTQNVIGPIFFEIIQRKGNEGFGEGNFRALFESIEQDQIRRGVI